MTTPIEPDHVMSHEAMQRINRDKMLDAAFNGAFADKQSRDLVHAVRAVMGGPFESERIKAQQEAK